MKLNHKERRKYGGKAGEKDSFYWVLEPGMTGSNVPIEVINCQLIQGERPKKWAMALPKVSTNRLLQ